MRYFCLYINNTRLVLPKHFRNIVLVCGVFLLLMSIGAQQAWSQPPCENTVFVTNQGFRMDLLGEAQSNFPVDCGGVTTGLEGADCICQELADAEGLGGTYKAWLSTDVDSPSTTFPQSICPYVMVNGVQVADNWTDLTDGNIDTCIRINETGGAQVGVCTTGGSVNGSFAVLTNTRQDGTSRGTQNCGDWTIDDVSTGDVRGGQFDKFNGRWTNVGNLSWSCDTSSGRRLYCFEQSDENIVLSPDTATNDVGTDHTVTATVESDGVPIQDVLVTFEIISGPNTGLVSIPNNNECSTNDDCTTDGNGQVSWTYSSVIPGTDIIVASFGNQAVSAPVEKIWESVPIPTLSEWGLIAMAAILGLVGFIVMRRRKVTA